MTEEDEIRIGTFEIKLQQLIDMHERLKAENSQLKEQLAHQSNELEKVRDLYSKLEKSYSNLKLAKIISINGNDSNNAAQRLSKLVREVDRCIALLNA